MTKIHNPICNIYVVTKIIVHTDKNLCLFIYRSCVKVLLCNCNPSFFPTPPPITTCTNVAPLILNSAKLLVIHRCQAKGGKIDLVPRIKQIICLVRAQINNVIMVFITISSTKENHGFETRAVVQCTFEMIR